MIVCTVSFVNKLNQNASNRHLIKTLINLTNQTTLKVVEQTSINPTRLNHLYIINHTKTNQYLHPTNSTNHKNHMDLTNSTNHMYPTNHFHLIDPTKNVDTIKPSNPQKHIGPANPIIRSHP